jgi:hypothetical protein
MNVSNVFITINRRFLSKQQLSQSLFGSLFPVSISAFPASLGASRAGNSHRSRRRHCSSFTPVEPIRSHRHTTSSRFSLLLLIALLHRGHSCHFLSSLFLLFLFLLLLLLVVFPDASVNRHLSTARFTNSLLHLLCVLLCLSSTDFLSCCFSPTSSDAQVDHILRPKEKAFSFGSVALPRSSNTTLFASSASPVDGPPLSHLLPFSPSPSSSSVPVHFASSHSQSNLTFGLASQGAQVGARPQIAFKLRLRSACDCRFAIN